MGSSYFTYLPHAVSLSHTCKLGIDIAHTDTRGYEGNIIFNWGFYVHGQLRRERVTEGTMKTAASMRPLLAAAAGARAATRVPAAAGRRAASGITATAGRRITAGARRTTTAPLRAGGVSVQTRAFSAGARRQEEAFDPATVERESDEVDVCIVGGGM